jgi:hypothetical protein
MCCCADAYGTAALLFCLFMGTFYQQPPMRKDRVGASKDHEPLVAKV